MPRLQLGMAAPGIESASNDERRPYCRGNEEEPKAPSADAGTGRTRTRGRYRHDD